MTAFESQARGDAEGGYQHPDQKNTRISRPRIASEPTAREVSRPTMIG